MDMGLEKRNTPRLYFIDSERPSVKVHRTESLEIPAEVLNISSGGICLSISSSHRQTPSQGDDIFLSGLGFSSNLSTLCLPPKVCYTYHSSDQKTVIIGLNFNPSTTGLSV